MPSHNARPRFRTPFLRLSLLTLMAGSAIVLPVRAASAVQASATAVQAGATAVQAGETLARKLAEMGSFEADYQAVSPHTQASIRLIVNHARQYSLFHFVSTGEVVTDYWVVLDFAEKGPQGRRYEMYLLSPEGGQRFALNPDEMLERPETPMGMFYFFTAAYLRHQPIKGSPSLESLSIRPRSPMLSMGLSKEQLQLSLGVTSKANRLNASWLDASTLAQATSATPSPQALDLIYPEGHQVSLDTATGLIRLEKWQLPGQAGSREIRLQSQGPLSQDLPFSELIPGFKSLPLQEEAPDNLREQFNAAFFTQLAETLPGLPGFASLEGPALAVYQEKVLADARAKVRARVREMVTPALARAFAETQLFPIYRRYRSDSAPNLAFKDFLELYRKELAKDPELAGPPEANQVIEPLIANIRTLLGNLSEAERAPLVRLYDMNIAPMVVAWKLEFTDAHLAHIDAMGLKP